MIFWVLLFVVVFALLIYFSSGKPKDETEEVSDGEYVNQLYNIYCENRSKERHEWRKRFNYMWRNYSD